MKRFTFLLTIATLVSLTQVVRPQDRAPTLRDEVRKNGYAWQKSMGHYPRTLGTFEDLIERTDMIVRGRVVDERTRLSTGERTVWTDYTIEVLDLFKDSQSQLAIGDRIVVTKGGGNLLIEGKPVRVETVSFPPIPWIAPHLFFITRWEGPRADGQYYFTGGEIGVFEIRGGRIFPSGRSNHPLIKEFHNMNEDEFVRLLKERIEAEASSNQSR